MKSVDGCQFSIAAETRTKMQQQALSPSLSCPKPPAKVPCQIKAPRLRPSVAGRLQPRECLEKLVCKSVANAVLDPADIIPDAYDSDDEEAGRCVPSSTWVAVAGAGPIGLLAAIYLARRGYQVDVYERRPNPAIQQQHQRSPVQDYPLQIPSRALLALKELGANVSFFGPSAVPYRGRWHISQRVPDTSGTTPGSTRSVAAAVLEAVRGMEDVYMRSALVGREQLVKELTREAKRLYPSRLRIHYGAEVEAVDLEAKTASVRLQETLAGGQLVAGANRSRAGRCLQVLGIRPHAGSQQEAPLDPLLPELAPPKGTLYQVGYNLLLGADGAESTVRTAMKRAKPKVRDFQVQRPVQDTEQWKSFTGLPQVPASGELLPSMAAHQPGEYDYVYTSPEGKRLPSLRLWLSSPNCLSGVVTVPSQQYSWSAADLDRDLQAAYGPALPAEWRQAIVSQTCGASAPAPVPQPPTVQCTQFHGPRVVLLGDAAHAMTNDLGQGLGCGIEGVRMLNLVLKVTSDNLDRVPMVFSEMRGEDTHCMQQLEGFQRSLRPGLKYSDPLWALAGVIGSWVWRSALLMLAVTRALMPATFPVSYVADRLRDARKGYSDTLKVLVRFAAGPVLLVLAVCALIIRKALLNFKYSMLWGLGG